MNFPEAMSFLQRGVMVRERRWDQGEYIYYHPDFGEAIYKIGPRCRGCFLMGKGCSSGCAEPYKITLDDIQSDQWETLENHYDDLLELRNRSDSRRETARLNILISFIKGVLRRQTAH